MRHVERTDSRFGFFRAFFEIGGGQIIGLATPTEHLRDGLAVAIVARLFPSPEFDGIRVEPGRRTLQPHENVILIGSAHLFIDPKAHRVSGTRPEPVGEDKLGDRLSDFEKLCCFSLTKDGDRCILEKPTGKRHIPKQYGPVKGEGKQVDYGVIRRMFRGPTQNTITIEGLHRLGTLGAAKVVTQQHYLDAFWKALQRFGDFDESRPVEILVRTTFQGDAKRGIYTLDNIHAVPLAIVYNGRWRYNMLDSSGWYDQLPWDVHLWVQGERAAVGVPPNYHDYPAPRLEIRADLAGVDKRLKPLANKVLPSSSPRRRKKGPTAEEIELLLEILTLQSNRLHVELVKEAPYGGGSGETIALPEGELRLNRRLQKQLVIHLALCRVLGRGFRCDDESLRRYFPEFKTGPSKKSRVARFIATIKGKLNKGFGPLLDPRTYLQIEYDHSLKTYSMRLDLITLVIKLRF